LEKGANRSLVGEARVGKTWLLQQIQRRWQRVMQRPLDGCVLLDMQMIEDGREFFEVLCEEMGLESSLRGNRLARALRHKRYILCLDEIDLLTDEARFQEADRRFLRGLADGADTPLSLVIASQRPLRELFPDSPLHSSPLADICGQMEVAALSLEQVREVVRACGIRVEKAQALWEASQGKPQMLLDLIDKLAQGKE
jgi:hypothetical protein